MSPLVVRGRCSSATAAASSASAGWIKALDAATGKVAWTAYNTGPDADVMIGPIQAVLRAGPGQGPRREDLAAGPWKIGGGNVWGWLSYDPELNLIYHGTGNPGPWNPEQRPGDNKWTAGVFARDPDTGEARWYYQWTPHDLFDHDGINENVLVDLPRRAQAKGDRPPGAQRLRLRARPGHRRGPSADPFVRITASKGVDLKTGRLNHNAEKHPKSARSSRTWPRSPRGEGLAAAVRSPRRRFFQSVLCDVAYDFSSGVRPYRSLPTRPPARPGEYRASPEASPCVLPRGDLEGRRAGKYGVSDAIVTMSRFFARDGTLSPVPRHLARL